MTNKLMYSPELLLEEVNDQSPQVSWPKTAKELGFGMQANSDSKRRITLSNWTEGDEIRWSFMHACELVASAEIHRGYEKPRPLESAIQDLNTLNFETYFKNQMSVEEMLAQTYTDGFLVLHKGRVITEQYYNDLQPHSKHLLQSVTKSIVGTLAAILIEQQLLNADGLIEDYIPELKYSGYYGSNVRQLMDMSASILYKEEYGVVSEVTMHEASAGWREREGQLSDVPESQELFLKTLQKDPHRNHGDIFSYVSCNTDVLGWVIERALQQSLPELLSEYVWSKIGAEENAHMLIDSWGLPASSGGLNVTLRDLARFGQLLCDQGHYKGNQLVPKSVVEDIRTGGNKEQWIKGQGGGLSYLMPGGSYRSQWWVTDFDSQAFYAAGIHGQHLFIAPEARVVIAKLSSQPQAITPEFTQNTLSAFESITQYLRIDTSS